MPTLCIALTKLVLNAQSTNVCSDNAYLKLAKNNCRYTGLRSSIKILFFTAFKIIFNSDAPELSNGSASYNGPSNPELVEENW